MLSPIVYGANTRLFVFFGGDHLDHVTNDTWVFDPAAQRWQQRHPKTAPPPRANHTLTASGDGKARLSGGFTHNNTDIWYMGPLYRLRDDGDWVYDVAANTWTSLAGQNGAAPAQQEYRRMEFCLGQCNSNTSYPTGFDFSRRSWVSGHTYKCFEYDPLAKLMVFIGHDPWSYLFDPAVADWIGRTRKPGGMSYDGSFYTLACCPVPAGIYCWTARGELFAFGARTRAWQPVKRTGDHLPGSAVRPLWHGLRLQA